LTFSPISNYSGGESTKELAQPESCLEQRVTFFLTTSCLFIAFGILLDGNYVQTF